jgi:ribonucleases P/MRP protein subunit RPP40
MKRVQCPDVAVAPAETGEGEGEFRDYCSGISEWLSLVSLGSPRVLADDEIDSYLSRYEVPRSQDKTEIVDLVVVKWTGFMPAGWITQLLVCCM